MAFKTGLPLDQALTKATTTAAGVKRYLTSFAAQLAGNITAGDALALADTMRSNIATLNSCAAVPGIAAYAQTQYADSAYDIAAEFSAMVAALGTVLSWLEANIPANGASVSNAALVYAPYTPSQTGPLLALVNTAIASIN